MVPGRPADGLAADTTRRDLLDQALAAVGGGWEDGPHDLPCRSPRATARENDFVLVPDLDGTRPLTTDEVRLPRRPPRRHRRRRGDPRRPDRARRRRPRSARRRATPRGSWTTATPTASPAEMCGNGSRVFAAYLRREGLVDGRTRSGIATRAGDQGGHGHRRAVSRSTSARGGVVDPEGARERAASTRRSGPGAATGYRPCGSTSATRTPSSSSRRTSTWPTSTSPSRPPSRRTRQHGTNVEFVRADRTGAHRHAGPRARRGGDPVVRYRRRRRRPGHPVVGGRGRRQHRVDRRRPGWSRRGARPARTVTSSWPALRSSSPTARSRCPTDPQDPEAPSRRRRRSQGIPQRLPRASAAASRRRGSSARRGRPRRPSASRAARCAQQVVQRRLAHADRRVGPDRGRTARPAGTSSGRRARTLPSPAAAALPAVRSSARSLTSTAYTVARGRAAAPRVSAIGPQPQPRSRRCRAAGGGAPRAAGPACPVSTRSGEKTPPAVTHGRRRARPGRPRRCGAPREAGRLRGEVVLAGHTPTLSG